MADSDREDRIDIQPVASIERTSGGCFWHPAVPWGQLAYETPATPFFRAMGYELSSEMMQDSFDEEDPRVIEYFEEGGPIPLIFPENTSPSSGWILVAILDTDDGPQAWWVRPLSGLDLLARDIAAWQAETFPQATPLSVATHLRREADELQQAPADPEEIADLFHLVVAAAAVSGVDLAAAVRRKFEKNKQRRWKAADRAGVVEHLEIDRVTPEFRNG